MYCSNSLFGIACRPLRNQWNYCILAYAIPLLVLVAARITQSFLASLLEN